MAVERSDALAPGEEAPDFSLPRSPTESFTSAQLLGHPAILAFYPADWSPVCGDQLALYQAVLPEFERYGAQLVGISVDGGWCHQAYSESRKLKFPLLSDFHPKGAVAREYGAYNAEWGVCVRALFVIDGEGVIRWSYLSPIDINPGADGILAALEQIDQDRQAAAP